MKMLENTEKIFEISYLNKNFHDTSCINFKDAPLI